MHTKILKIFVAIVGAMMAMQATQAQMMMKERSVFIKEAKEQVANSMIDPESARYRNLFLSELATQALCGEINGKNRYGGYVGFQKFYSIPFGSAISTGQDDKSFEIGWNSYCKHKVVDVK